jgi:phosphocarrier protein FPr
VPIAVAAGLDEDTFGTDAQQIQAAIEEVDGPEGVVVLMDLGSAILSAEMALEFLDEDARSRVVLSPAPLIEGLIAAAVTAAGGAGRAEVAREAERGLRPKLEHLGESAQPGADADADADGDLEAEFTIVNDDGLHARPAAILVASVRRYDAEVSLRCPPGEGPSVSAGSLTDLMTMTAGMGARVELRARGPQAQAALDEVLALAERGFSPT